MRREKGWPLALLLLTLLLAACNVNLQPTAGPLESRQETVPLDDAATVRVELNLYSGNITLRGGAADLMEAEFRYNVPAWDPTVTYEDGVLTVTQGTTEEQLPSNTRNEWDITLNSDLPLELVFNSGAVNADLDLSTLNLSALTLDGGAGNFAPLDLGGQYAELSAAQVELQAGEVALDLSGSYPALDRLTVEVGTGNLTVRVPADVNVAATATVGTGNVAASGFTQRGDTYSLDVDGAEMTLTLDLQVTTGNITLEAAE